MSAFEENNIQVEALYESSIGRVKFTRKMLPRIIGTSAMAATGNYMITRDIASPFVWGAVVAGIAISAALEGVNRFEERAIQTPLEQNYVEEFIEEI